MLWRLDSSTKTSAATHQADDHVFACAKNHIEQQATDGVAVCQGLTECLSWTISTQTRSVYAAWTPSPFRSEPWAPAIHRLAGGAHQKANLYLLFLSYIDCPKAVSMVASLCSLNWPRCFFPRTPIFPVLFINELRRIRC